MAELVREDAGEEEDDEDHTLPRRLPPTGPPGRSGNPDQEQEEGDMNPDYRSGDAGNRDGPEHDVLHKWCDRLACDSAVASWAAAWADLSE